MESMGNKSVKRKANRLMETAGDLAETVKDKAEHALEKAKDKAENTLETAKDKAENTMEIAKDKAEDLGKAAGRTTSRVAGKALDKMDGWIQDAKAKLDK